MALLSSIHIGFLSGWLRGNIYLSKSCAVQLVYLELEIVHNYIVSEMYLFIWPFGEAPRGFARKVCFSVLFSIASRLFTRPRKLF